MKGIAATSWATDRIDIFYLDVDSMTHQAWNGTRWAGENAEGIWDNLGGSFASIPVAVSAMVSPPPIINPGGPPPISTAVGPNIHVPLPTPKVHRVDVFGVGTDFAMYQQTLWNGVPAASPQFVNLGGSFLSAPCAIAWQNSRIDLFGLGQDRAMYQRTWNGQAWSPAWVSLGGSFSSEASVVSWAPNRLDIVARGSDFTLRHRAYDGANWLNDWQNLGGSLASAPTMVSWGPNRLDVFAIGNDGALKHRWWDGMIWNDWESLNVPAPNPNTNITLVSQPSVVSWGPERLDLFVVGSDGVLYHFWWQTMAWNGPEALGGDIAGTPAAIALAPNQLHLVKPSTTGQLCDKTWNGTEWSPKLWNIFAGRIHLPTRYRFSIDLLRVDTPRAAISDTDTSQCSVTPGNWATQSAIQLSDGLGSSSEAQTNLLHLDPVAVDLCEYVIFNYQILNKADPDATKVGAFLASTGSDLVTQAVQSVVKQLAAGILSIVTVEIASTGVPVLGSLLGLLEQWLVGQLTAAFQPGHCDGFVAVEQIVLLGRDLHLKTAAGPYTVTTIHNGTDSDSFCGPNSKYEVHWSIARYLEFS